MSSMHCLAGLAAVFMFALLELSSGTAIDNNVLGVPEVICREDAIRIVVHVRRPFAGHVYVKNHFDTPGCHAAYVGGNEHPNELIFDMGLRGGCDLRRERTLNPPGLAYKTVVIVQFHHFFVTKVDGAFAITCFYRETEKHVTNALDVSMIPTTELHGYQAMPTCAYQILQGSPEGPAVRFARVGDKLFHKWSCVPPSTHGILVHSCVARDSAGHEFRLVDDRGCSTDPIGLSDLTYSPDLSMAWVLVHAFKFADRVEINFRCQISLCIKAGGGCEGFSPPHCVHEGHAGHGPELGALNLGGPEGQGPILPGPDGLPGSYEGPPPYEGGPDGPLPGGPPQFEGRPDGPHQFQGLPADGPHQFEGRPDGPRVGGHPRPYDGSGERPPFEERLDNGPPRPYEGGPDGQRGGAPFEVPHPVGGPRTGPYEGGPFEGPYEGPFDGPHGPHGPFRGPHGPHAPHDGPRDFNGPQYRREPFSQAAAAIKNPQEKQQPEERKIQLDNGEKLLQPIVNGSSENATEGSQQSSTTTTSTTTTTPLGKSAEHLPRGQFGARIDNSGLVPFKRQRRSPDAAPSPAIGAPTVLVSSDDLLVLSAADTPQTDDPADFDSNTPPAARRRIAILPLRNADEQTLARLADGRRHAAIYPQESCIAPAVLWNAFALMMAGSGLSVLAAAFCFRRHYSRAAEDAILAGKNIS